MRDDPGIRMFSHYAHFFARSLLRQKVLSLVSIAGFALGLVCVFFTTRYVLYELSYDSFLRNADRIFRINTLETGSGQSVAITPFILGGRLKAEFPEIEDMVRTIDYDVTGKVADRVFTNDKLTFADSSLIRIFGLQFLEGDPATALSAPGTIIVSRSVSRKYFGSESPLGRVVEFDRNYRSVVGGVFNDIPRNSHLDLSFVSGINSFAGFYGPGSELMTTTWDGAFRTYILLAKGASINRLAGKMPGFVERNASQVTARETQFAFQNVQDLHLYSAAIKFKEESAGDITTVYGLAAITLLLLVIVSTNYIVMAVARIPTRVKEIGLRKVLGAGDTDLSRQFILEAVLFCVLSSLLAISVIELVFPFVKQYAGTIAAAGPGDLSSYAAIFLAYCLTLGFVSGSVPALLTFRITPAGMLQRAFPGGSKSSSVRTLAVVMQLVICISVISLALVVYEQMTFVRNTDLGFTKEGLLTIDVANTGARGNLAGLRKSLEANRDILGLTTATGVPPQENDYTGVEVMTPHDGKKHMGTKFFSGEFNFAAMLGLRILKGRTFDQMRPADANCIMINNAFAEEMGWDDPIGRDVIVYLAAGRPFKVIGVVQDFNFRSLHQKIEPVILLLNYPLIRKMLVRVNPTAVASVTGFIRNEWKRLYPDEALSLSYVDADFGALYGVEEQQGRLLLISAAVSIFLALIGLLGMSLFNIQRRVKEIGIRKVLGASTNSLLMIQSRYYVGMLLVAGILSLPVSWYISRSWLERFAYRMPSGAGEFLLAFLFVSVVTYFTAFVQIVRSSSANPVDALRYE